MGKPKLWTKDFLNDAMVNLIVYMVYYLLMVTITSHAMDKLHASSSQAGLACGIFIIGALIARTLTGRTIERVGRKRMLFFGLCFYFFMTLLYFGVHSLPLLLVVRLFHGMGFGISGTATGTIAAGIIPGSRRGEGISYYAMSATLASAIGPSLGMLLNRRVSFNMILIVASVLLAVSFAAVFFLNVPEVKLTMEQLEKLRGFKLSSFFEVKAIPISVVSVFIGFGISSILGFLSPFSVQAHMVDAGGFFFIVYAGAILASRPLTGMWFDRKGENFVMYPSFVLFAAGLALLGTAHHSFPLLLAGVISGLGYGTFLSGAQAIAIKVSPHHRIGMATSTFFSFIDGGAGFGPFLLGCLIPMIGLRGMYLSMAVVVFACSFAYYLLHGRRPTGSAAAR